MKGVTTFGSGGETRTHDIRLMRTDCYRLPPLCLEIVEITYPHRNCIVYTTIDNRCPKIRLLNECCYSQTVLRYCVHRHATRSVSVERLVLRPLTHHLLNLTTYCHCGEDLNPSSPTAAFHDSRYTRRCNTGILPPKLHNDTKCILRDAPRFTLCMQDSDWLHFPNDVPYRLCFVKGKAAAEQNQNRLSLLSVKDNFGTPLSNIVGSRSLVLALRSVGIGGSHPVSNKSKHPFAHEWVALAFSLLNYLPIQNNWLFLKFH